MAVNSELVQVNNAATRGIIGDYDRTDLSQLTLGASLTAIDTELTLLLGSSEFRVLLKLYEGRPHQVEVVVGNAQLYWVTLIGNHQLSAMLDAVVLGCTECSLEPLY